MTDASRSNKNASCPKRRSRGAVVIEFAIGLSIFWIVFISVIEFGRLLYSINAAEQASVRAARVVAVCGPDYVPQARTRAAAILAGAGMVALPADWISFQYTGEGGGACEGDDCLFVKATIANLKANSLIPGFSDSFSIPSSTVTIMREMFENAAPQGLAFGGNPYCTQSLGTS